MRFVADWAKIGGAPMTDAPRSQVDSAELAVVAALDWQSSPESRQQATVYLESVSLCVQIAFGGLPTGLLC